MKPDTSPGGSGVWVFLILRQSRRRRSCRPPIQRPVGSPWAAGGLAAHVVHGLEHRILGLVVGLELGLAGGLGFGLLLGILFGALACLRHLILRCLLLYSGFAPLRFIRFLDEATARLFLRRAGSGYIFVHRLLLEHFAGLDTIPSPHRVGGHELDGGEATAHHRPKECQSHGAVLADRDIDADDLPLALRI